MSQPLHHPSQSDADPETTTGGSEHATHVQRHLTGEQVQAVPPSLGYRLKKFVKRNKVQVIAASLVLLALLGGVIGTSLDMIEARREPDRADQQAAKATGDPKIAVAKAVEFDDKAKEALLAGATEKQTNDDTVVLAAKVLFTELLTLKGHTEHVSSVAFSPDGKRILTGSGDKTAMLFNIENRFPR